MASVVVIVVIVVVGRDSDGNLTSVTFVPAAHITGTGLAMVTNLQPVPVPISAHARAHISP